MDRIVRLKAPASAVFLTLLWFWHAGVSNANAQTVTMQSLLKEMTQRDMAAQWPSSFYACKEVTSHDPRKKDPADAAGWHSNQDYGNFIRLETNDNRPEWVILDTSGPGAIVRIWVPLLADKDRQIVRFYFDGSTKPAIAVKLNDLISGQSFVRPPLAFVSWNQTNLGDELKSDYKARRGVGADLYLPIPFAKGCKVTLDQTPFYYCINYRSYGRGTSVKTFTMEDFKKAKEIVNEAAAALLDNAPAPGDSLYQQATVVPGEKLALDLPSGAQAVRDIQVQVPVEDAPQVLRSIILQATFDEETTIWCPLSELFGVGTHLQAVQDWDRKVTANGKLEARWVMPYRHSGRLSLKNAGQEPVSLKLSARTGAWTWNDRSLYFHANWRCQLGITTRPKFDWNYIQIRGQGVYVGDTLTVFSPSPNWYGEGDERIYIDGEKLPSHIGTGTEDYYGYAWGMANFFSSPFISTPERDLKAQDDWRGYTTDSRLRFLDAIPFRRQLKLDMEVWDWADTQVDYAVATFWYGRPGADSNRQPELTEAASALKKLPGR